MNIRKQLEEYMERETRKLFGGSASTELLNSTSAPVLTVDTIRECQQKIYALQEKPYRELLASKGFDPDRDMIVFSTDAAQALGIDEQQIPPGMRDRVKINKHVEGGPYLVKNTLPDLGI